MGCGGGVARALLRSTPSRATGEDGVLKYLVTGAAGFIGSHLMRALIDAGHEALGIDCFTDYYDPALKEENAAGLDIARIDLTEDPLDFAGLDGVFHLAAQPGVRSFGDVFRLYLSRNVLASQRVFEAASRDGVRVVFASSSSIYGDALIYPTPEDTAPTPISPYGITKLAGEHLARAYGREFGLDAVCLRYFNTYGPSQRPDMAFTRMVGALAEGRPFEIYGDGTQSRAFTYVSDTVGATILAMEGAPRGSVYNVGGGTEASLLETIAVLERLSGRTLELRHGARVDGDVRRTTADTARIRAELGWHPRVSLEDGLRAEWEWASGRVGAR